MIGYGIDFVIICLVIYLIFRQGEISQTTNVLTRYIEERDDITIDEIVMVALLGGDEDSE